MLERFSKIGFIGSLIFSLHIYICLSKKSLDLIFSLLIIAFSYIDFSSLKLHIHYENFSELSDLLNYRLLEKNHYHDPSILVIVLIKLEALKLTSMNAFMFYYLPLQLGRKGSS